MKVSWVFFQLCYLILPSHTFKVFPAGVNPLTCPNYPHCPLPDRDNKPPLGFPFFCPNFPFCYENPPLPLAVKTLEEDQLNKDCHFTNWMCLENENNIIETLEDKTDASACEKACKGSSKCTHFSFTKYSGQNKCHILSSCSIKIARCPSNDHCASGSKECKCPKLDKKPEVGVAKWRCEDGLDPYRQSLDVGTKCTLSCSSWSSTIKTPQQQTRGLTLQSTCLPGMTWSTTKLDTSDTSSIGISNYYKWPQPDEADPQCKDDACTDLGPFTVNPNDEEGAKLTCEGWSSDRFETPFTIKSGDVCQLHCHLNIVARLSCKEGRWSYNPGEEFYCFNKPNTSKRSTTTKTSIATTTTTTSTTTTTTELECHEKKIVEEKHYDNRFLAKYVFIDGDDEFGKNYWVSPDYAVGGEAFFIIDFGCEKTINGLVLKNTYNSNGHNDRGTKDFTVFIGNSQQGPWTAIVTGSLIDARNQEIVPKEYFEAQGTGQFIKFEVDSFYGYGGGLQFMAFIIPSDGGDYNCWEIGVDYPGYDIDVSQVANAEECQQKCQQNLECTNWAWEINKSPTQTCWLKNGGYTSSNKKIREDRINAPKSCSTDCPNGWIRMENGPCFFVNTNKRTWAQAEEDCQQYGSHLSSIHAENELAFVKKMTLDSIDGHSFWLGGSDSASEGVWKWTDGSSFNYQKWYSGEPNNSGNGEDCLHLHKKFKAWNDDKCNKKLYSVCRQ